MIYVSLARASDLVSRSCYTLVYMLLRNRPSALCVGMSQIFGLVSSRYNSYTLQAYIPRLERNDRE